MNGSPKAGEIGNSPENQLLLLMSDQSVNVFEEVHRKSLISFKANLTKLKYT
jgi:hypothetical protein